MINVNHPFAINNLTIKDSMFVVCYNGGLGFIVNDSLTKTFTPNTPYSNLFLNLSVDPNGVLWCATGSTSNGGFMMLDNNQVDKVSIRLQIPTYNQTDISRFFFLKRW